MFDPDRNEVRQFYCSLWRKHQQGLPLEGSELTALPIVLAHPEYHPLLEAPESALEQEFPPETGQSNPFLHMSLHLAIAEQVAINQPPGIRQHFERLLGKTGDTHPAQHAMMDCLVEMIWQAQRNGTGYDATLYLDCLHARQ